MFHFIFFRVDCYTEIVSFSVLNVLENQQVDKEEQCGMAGNDLKRIFSASCKNITTQFPSYKQVTSFFLLWNEPRMRVFYVTCYKKYITVLSGQLQLVVCLVEDTTDRGVVH